LRIAGGAQFTFGFNLPARKAFMFAGKIGIPELLIVLVIALLIFGPSKISSLGKSLGEGIRGFKSAGS
jgi:TatA/E family protein of Tat protein translocase